MENKYTITQDVSNYNYRINNHKIPEEIFEEVGYRVENREDFIDTLIDWISEAEGHNRQLMKDDLKMLIEIEDEFILSSTETNDYLFGNTDEFNSKCKEILELKDREKYYVFL